MKKQLSKLAIFALLLSTASCADEKFVDELAGGETTVTFNAQLPTGLQTRVAGDGQTATTLSYAVYEQGKTTPLITNEDEVTFENRQATVSLRLAAGKTYDFLFWADSYGEGDTENPYTVNFDAQTLTVDYSDAKSNDEARDAFFGNATVTVKGAMSENIILKRPFAQLNIGTDDMAAAKASGLNTEALQSSVTVSGIFSSMNLMSGEVSNSVDVTFGSNAIPKEKFTVEDNEYDYLALNYLLVSDQKGLVNCEFSYTTDGATTDNTLTIDNVPVQRNYRTNIFGSLLTGSVDFDITIAPAFDGENMVDAPVTVIASDAETLAKALTANEEYISVVLESDVDLSIRSLGNITPGSGEYKLGGDKTRNITIDLNGKKLNITTDYMSSIGTKNPDVTFNIKNGTMTSTGNSAQTWNIYDLTFANCDYVMEDVVFDKAIAFTNTGRTVTMNNVTINETNDFYAMWISAVGQTLNIDGLTVNCASGRGIKIDEEYVGTPEKVTLNISDSEFTTKNKAAIMVKSEAGAEINVSNVDISGVAADTEFTVWVDEDSKAYADKVIVNGAYVKVEGSYGVVAKDAQSMADALKADAAEILVVLNNSIDLPIADLGEQIGGSGEYRLGGANTKNITLDLNGKKLNLTTSYMSAIGANNPDAIFTIKNGEMTSSSTGGTWNIYDLMFKNCNYVIEDVTFGKAIAFDNAKKTVTMNNVTINENKNVYAMWITATGQTINIDGLTLVNNTFLSFGRGIKIDEEYVGTPEKVTLTVKNSTFKTAYKAAIMVKSVAGAEIFAENIDISKVASDKVNAVWVDEASKDYADKVIVHGATKKVEGE